MLEASPYLRNFLYHDFARRLTRLGYDIEPPKLGEGFRIAGITPEAEELFSARARQRDAFVERYTETFGHRPNKRRIEQFIKEDKGAAELRFRAEFKAAFGNLPDKPTIEAFAIDSVRRTRGQASSACQFYELF